MIQSRKFPVGTYKLTLHFASVLLGLASLVFFHAGCASENQISSANAFSNLRTAFNTGNCQQFMIIRL